jgi:hypothetical protein
MAEGRLRKLIDADELTLEKRGGPAAQRIRRDPRMLMQLFIWPTGRP